MIGVQQGVAQLVILIGELDGGGIKHDALLHAVALGKGTGGNIPNDDLQGNDGDFLHQGFPGAEFLDKVGGNALLFQVLHQAVAHLVVDDTLAGDGALFQTVEGGGIVLVIHDQQLGIVGLKNLFGFSFVQLFQFLHSINMLLLW